MMLETLTEENKDTDFGHGALHRIQRVLVPDFPGRDLLIVSAEIQLPS